MVSSPWSHTVLALLVVGLYAAPARPGPADASDVTTALVGALRDDNALVRKRAAIALERLGPKARDAAPALERALKDTDAEVRAAAAAALETIDAPRSLAALTARVGDKGAEGRRRAEACRELGERFGKEPAAVRALEAALGDPVINLDAARALEMIDTRAKQQSAAADHRGTRVALLNLKQVVMGYKKWIRFTDELKAEYKQYQERVEGLNRQMEGLKKEMAAATAPEEKTKIEKQTKDLQRQFQRISDEAKRELGKKESVELVAVYKEMTDVVAAYARENDIDLVMHYNDALTEAEMNSPQNIQRKLVAGPTTPLYVKPGTLDISAAILERLNDRYSNEASHAPGK
jgi:Skp family chaperone for outer membrane proteins